MAGQKGGSHRFHRQTKYLQCYRSETLRLDLSLGWREPIIEYLTNQILPADKAEAQKLQHRATRYRIINGKLYKDAYSKNEAFLSPLLRCLGPEEAEIVLREIHEGDCGNHSGGRSLAQKVLTQGYYWPRLHIQAKEYVKKCRQCQLHAPSSHQPATELHTLRMP